MPTTKPWPGAGYASYGAGAPTGQPVEELERALDARGECGARALVWITETGVGAPHSGEQRETATAASEHEGCLALAAQLAIRDHAQAGTA